MNLEAQLKALLAEAADLQKKGTDLTSDEVDRASVLVTEIADVKAKIAANAKASAQLAALSAKGVERDDEGAPVQGTIGERFVKSDAMRQFRTDHPKVVESKNMAIRIEAKHIGGSKTAFKADPAPLNTGNADLAPVRLPGIEDVTYRKPNTLLDLITQGSTDSPWLQYRQLVGYESNAGIVGEAKTTTGTTKATGLKPLSTLSTRTADAKAYTYADGIEVTNQELADDGALTALIDGFLTQNVRDEIERVILNGAGTADEPAGILNTTGVLQQTFATDAVTSLRKAKTLLANTSNALAQAVVLNPEDDEAFDLIKDTNGRYLGNGPWGAGPSSIWAVPRVTSNRIPVGTALIGDFSGVQLLIYEALSILAFNQHKDYAQRNLTYVRAELRALQLIRQPAKLAIVDIKGA